jgi:4-hydroxy-tetrahydrodipicolinate synthase
MLKMGYESLKIQGIIPALITPMNEDETVSEKGLRAVIDHVIEGGVHGIFILGSQGESFALTMEEKRDIISIAVEASSQRVPVYVGTGTITTSQSSQMTALARELGADAVSVITPYFIRPSQEELVDHYRAIAEAAGDMPVLLYNNPMRTGVSIDVETVVTLAQMDNVVGMKDSSADLIQTMKYIDATRDMDFSVLVGNDASIFATMLSGGKGAVAATANVAPALVVGIYNAVRSGDIDKARELQYKLFPIRNAFGLGTFPLVVKEAMNIIGLPAGPARRPIQRLSPEKRRELRKILSDAGLLLQQ